MEKITFVQPGIKFVRFARMMAIFMVFGLFSLHGIAATHTHTLHSQLNFAVEGGNASSKVSMWKLSGLWNPFEASIGNPDDCDGDGVTCEQEVIDGTDPNDPCDFILEHQNCTPSTTWLNMDCDGDGVTNGKEKYDGTDPLDPCSFVLEHQNCTPTTKWKNLDCDGDGVTNGKEKEDGTDPLDPCDLVLEHQNCSPSYTWKNLDCDGDGVTNGKEKEDGTDPFDPCDFIWGHQNCTPTQEWKDLDCDGDGVTNGDEKTDGTDPLDPCDYNPESVTLPQSGDYLTADCDGDGVTNGDENEDGTDPNDSCDFNLASQTVATSSTWNTTDCDGDGVTNGDEKTDGTDPLDPCDYNPESVTLPQSGDYLTADCDGDGVTNGDENEDGTDPNDSCDFNLASQTVATSSTWNTADCDGDGVTNGDEKTDGTDPLDPCDYNPESVTLPQSGDYLTADCDGDGVTNGDENEDGTDPNDSCDFNLASQTVATSSTWNSADCDGDGVTNSDEKTDGTDPLDPCDYNPESVTLPQSAEWEVLDCDNDGNPNGTDPNPLEANAMDDSGATPALTEVAINILENDDFLPNNDPNNVGSTSLSSIGGNALGTVIFDAETGFVTYTPVASESNSTVTIIYQVCNVLVDPNVCASATIFIEVGPNTIDAVDDSYVSDTAGGIIPDSNVLSNDTLNGEPVTLEDVILTSTPTDVLTVNEDGTITVAPDAAPGTYTVEYTICEIANGSNCDTATVSVVVEPGSGNVIDAVDDSFVSDTAGGVVPDSNVLSNDTLNGEPVTLEDVILTSTPTDVLTVNEDGTITVAPDAAPGTYTVEYTICEIANGSNCDTATVSVVVEPGSGNVIDAVDDSFVSDTAGGIIPDSNVLSNDTLNGEPVSLEDVILTSTPTDVLTINEDGTITVAPDAAPGTYTVEYTICEIANSSNCDTATVSVVVEAGSGNVIDAVDDSYVSDTAGGIISDSNVLSNDALNGEPVTLEDVILTSTPTDVLTVNEDGTITVAPDAAPGTYTVEYTICEIANVDNCDTATVTVEVQEGMGNTIDAVDDSYVSDTSGGIIPDSNVLSNDTLNGEPVTLEDVILTSTPTDVLTVNEDGTITVAPDAAPGTYTVEYTICEIANVENCDTATVTVEVQEGMGNTIDAVDDSYVSDTSGGIIPDSNVLSNDTLNGEPVTLEDVILTSTPTDVLTVNEGGTITVAPDAAPGTYTVEYTICEIANVDNCDTATVTVEVQEGMGNIIDAVDDSYVSDTSGGIIPDSNVLSNDTLNGEPVTSEDVILTSTPTDVLTINDDGTIIVISGTQPGTYTISYTICEIANVDNCDTAIVTIVIEDDAASKIEVNQMLTPNGDLKNDFLFIRGVERIKTSTLKIFNRWGVVVYEGKNYDNVRNVFDGRSRSRSTLSVNEYLPAGVYFYIFNYETDEGSFTDSEYIYISR